MGMFAPSDPVAQSAEHERECASHQYDVLNQARAEYPGTLNFGAYARANNKDAIGYQAPNYYGKSMGNDSANLQSVINAPDYWTMVCHRRPEYLDDLLDSKKGMKKSASSPAIETKSTGLDQIKKSMYPYTLTNHKPKFCGEIGDSLRFNSFQNLRDKYNAPGKSTNFDYDKLAHRSSKAEINFVVSTYFRQDAQWVLDGYPKHLRKTKSIAEL